MVSKKSRTEVRVKKHNRMRNHLAGTAQRPRLAVFRSNNHMYAQIIDDTVGNTLVSASTLDKDIKAELEKTNNVDAAAKLGTVIAKKALDKGISTVVFDRGGFIYAGKVKALAEAAREAGLDFQEETNMKREIIDASQLELVDQVVDIKRVTKVVKGGRNMRFTALVVVGDKNGHVGAGLGKAAEIPEAIRKGKEDAIKSMVNVKLDENNSITHDVTGKYTGASVLLKKSPEGTGIIAGGPARSVCEIAGIQNIRTKSLGSNNKQNVVLATIEALKQLRSPEDVAKLRGKSVEEILG